MNRGTSLLCGALLLGMAAPLVTLAQAKTPADLMVYKPRQPDVDYEIPTAAELAKCKVEVERRGKMQGFVMYGPEGQVLRRFTDTDGVKGVDQWRYYQHGIEVFREIDTDDDNTPNEYRWLNLGGSRWGIDLNEDGRIDQWKTLSAAEATKEAIRAMIAGDAAALQTLMVTPEELKALGVVSSIIQKAGESTSGAGTKAQAIVKRSKVLTSQAKWVRLDALMPSVIPADEGKAAQDLFVYENAMAVVEVGNNQFGMVQVGEMIRVGEVWKLTQVPQPIEKSEGVTTTEGGLFMQPLLAAAGGGEIAAPSPELQKLIEALQKLDAKPPQLGNAPVAQLVSYNSQRADLLMQMWSKAEGEDEKAQFLRQYVDGIAAAVQTDTFPDGLRRIQQIEDHLQNANSKSPLLPYVVYRRIMAGYSADMRKADDEKKPDVQMQKRAETQTAWLKSLDTFVEDYPNAEDASEAIWQLAIAEEFGGKLESAVNWYKKLSARTGTSAAEKASGAIRRLDLKGKSFVLAGRTLTGAPINTATAYRDKTLLVVYWATWCEPCKTDLPQIRALYKQYRARGFEVLGVCLDIPGGTPQEQTAQLQKYVAQTDMPWPHIFEPGGLDSPPAVQYGIITLPTMFLVDPKGQVLSRQSSVEELKQVLPKLFPQK